METENNQPKIQMIHGTSGNRNYAAFARKGSFALAIKPNAISPGTAYGGSDQTVYFGARLRSCYATELGDDTKGIETGPGMNFKTAWPNIVFDKMGDDRASTQVGTFIRGNLENDPQAIAEKFKSNDFMLSMADYLLGIAGPEYVLVDREELAAFLTSIYKDQVSQIVAYMQQQQEAKVIKDKMAEYTEAHLGVFGIQAQQLKEMQAQAGIKDKSDEDEQEDPNDSTDDDAGEYKGSSEDDYD